MWDERYSAAHYIYGTEPNDFLAQHFGVIPKGRVLCIAEGEGRNAVFLAKQGYTVTGVDASAVGLAKARQLAQNNNVSIECVQSDLAVFDLGCEQWDSVVSIFCHLPSKVRQGLYPRIIEGLKRGGVFLLEAYTPAQLQRGTGGPSDADFLLTAEILQNELGELEFKHLKELERSVVEGTHHTGLASVVQAVAVKP